jgi:hypothetical protein
MSHQRVLAAPLAGLDCNPGVAVRAATDLRCRAAQGRSLMVRSGSHDPECGEERGVDVAPPGAPGESLGVEVDEESPRGPAAQRPKLGPVHEGHVTADDLLVEPVAQHEETGTRRAPVPVALAALPTVEEAERIDPGPGRRAL